MIMNELKPIVDRFIREVQEAVAARLNHASRALFAQAHAANPLRRIEAALNAAVVPIAKPARKPAAPQLCPVPGCKHRAAPVFGMVCARHKSVPKTQIAKYRAARRARR